MIQNTSINSLNNISKPNLDNKIGKRSNEIDKTDENNTKEFTPKDQIKNDLALEEDLEALNNIEVSNERVENSENLLNNNTNIEKTEKDDISKEFIVLNTDVVEIDIFLDEIKNKEPREQLFDLAQIKTKTEDGKKYLEEKIKNLRDTYLKKFDNGINKNNIKNLISTVKEVTAHKGVFKTDRLIKPLYNSLEKLEKLYSNDITKLEKLYSDTSPSKLDGLFSTTLRNTEIDIRNQISEIINKGNEFIEKNPESTRKNWVLKTIDLLNNEIIRIDNKHELLKNINHADYPNKLIELLTKARKEKMDIKMNLNFEKIYDVFLNSNRKKLDNFVDLTSSIARHNHNLANDIILKAYKEGEINYFELYACSIQIGVEIDIENPTLKGTEFLTSKKDYPLNNQIKTLNSLVESFKSLNPTAELDSIFTHAEILSKLDNEAINKISKLSNNTSINEFDTIKEKLTSIIGNKFDLNNKLGAKTFNTIVNYIVENNTLNYVKGKEPREQLFLLRNDKSLSTEEGKNLRKLGENKIINKYLGNFKKGINNNSNEFVKTMKDITKHNGAFKTNRLIKNFYNSLDNLDKTYLLDSNSIININKKIEANNNAILEAEKFIKNNPKSTRIEWVKESINILKAEKLNLLNRTLEIEINDTNNIDSEYIKLNKIREKLETSIKDEKSIFVHNDKSQSNNWLKAKIDGLEDKLEDIKRKIDSLPEYIKVVANLKKVERKDFDKIQNDIMKNNFLEEKNNDLELFKNNKNINTKPINLPDFISDNKRLSNIYNLFKGELSKNNIDPKTNKDKYLENMIGSFSKIMKSNDLDTSFAVALLDENDLYRIIEKIKKDNNIPSYLYSDIRENLTNSFRNDRPTFNFTNDIVNLNGKEYERIKKLGSGSFGAAFLYKNINDENDQFVAKFQLENNNKLIQKEASILKYVLQDDLTPHKNVLGFKGVITGELGTFPVTLTEVANGGELRDIMGKIKSGKYIENGKDKYISNDEKILIEKYLLKNILEGMKYLQEERHIKHLDLKPENIFFDKNTMLPKIADFGLSSIGLEEEYGGKGTPGYTPPEMSLDANINDKADNWSLGVIIHEMILGNMPKHITNSNQFDHIDIAENAVKRNNIKSFDESGNIEDTTAFGRIINSMMDINYKNRPSISSILEFTFFKEDENKDDKVKELLSKILN